MTDRFQRTAVQAGALFVLVAVMLPAIVYMGHWSTAAGNHDHAGEAHATSHEDHCHIGPAKCSGGISTVGSWWVGEDPVSIEPESVPTVTPGDEGTLAAAEVSARIFQPPRLA